MTTLKHKILSRILKTLAIMLQNCQGHLVYQGPLVSQADLPCREDLDFQELVFQGHLVLLELKQVLLVFLNQSLPNL
jgi:hypothetical protein